MDRMAVEHGSGVPGSNLTRQFRIPHFAFRIGFTPPPLVWS